jgi:hypothetical protein
MSSGQKGYAALLILIVAFLILSASFYFVFGSNLRKNDIQGASSTKNGNSKHGFSILISSSTPSWDLVEYLCSSEDECTSGLTSGTRWGSISGGETELHEVILDYNNQWDSFGYIKLFVRSGLFSDESAFRIVDKGQIPDSKVYQIEEDGTTYDVVVIPTKMVSENFYESARFSNL